MFIHMNISEEFLQNMAEPNGQYLQLDSRVFVCLLIGGFPS